MPVDAEIVRQAEEVAFIVGHVAHQLARLIARLELVEVILKDREDEVREFGHFARHGSCALASGPVVLASEPPRRHSGRIMSRMVRSSWPESSDE